MESKQKPIDTAKIYPDPVAHSMPEEKQRYTVPTAMADLEIMKAEGTKSAADQNPEVRNIALLLLAVLGITLFSQISLFLVANSFNTTHPGFWSTFVSSNGFLGITLLVIQVIAIFVLLFTRNTSYVKVALLTVGISFGVTLVKGVVSFDISPSVVANFAALVVNFFILRKIFRVYPHL
jgi:hypothetical protein